MDPIAHHPSAGTDQAEKDPPASVTLPDGSRLSAPAPHVPDQLRVGQWVVVGQKAWRIDDLHKTQSGGRLVVLHERPGPPLSLEPREVRTVYTMHAPPIRKRARRPDVA